MSLIACPGSGALTGSFRPPGDKSISHRALIFSCLASGVSRVEGLLEGADVMATLAACRQLGMRAEKEQDVWVLQGVGQGGLQAPTAALDMGNSGTAMRLLAGVLAAQDFDSVLLGDESLSQRPMRRIVEPLTRMGAKIDSEEGVRPPLRVHATRQLNGIHYTSPVASAQVKSCLLLAGLYAEGTTRISEPMTSRDHTERLLPVFGVSVGADCSVQGGARLQAAEVQVPADISSAAFFMVAAALVPGSEVCLLNVGLNPSRDGIIHVLRAMGADISIENSGLSGEEPVADVRVRYAGRLQGVDIDTALIPSLIDELPVIFALAATANGTTRLREAEELRVKESDRIAVMARGLQTLGVELTEYPDGIDITGGSIGSGHVDGAGDHRCAMSFCILGQVAAGPVHVDGAQHINTSYPGFVKDLQALGGQIEHV